MIPQVIVASVLVVSVLASGPCAPNEDMLKMLTGLHNAPSYATMSAENKALVPELFAEAQSCQLTAYMYTIGLHKVLAFLDSLTPGEAKFFYGYFSGHLKYEGTLQQLYGTTAKP